MAYKITHFGDIALPQVMFAEDMSTAAVASTVRQAAGAAFDWRGAARQWPTYQQLAIRAHYSGEALYLIDESSNDLVDEAGNNLIAGEATTILRNQIDDFAAMVGRSAALWRERLDDGARQWRTARLLQVRPRQSPEQWSADVAEVEATFEAANGGWRSAAAVTAASTLAANVPRTLIIAPGGNIEVRDAILTVTASATITSITVTAAALGVALAWTGSLTSGQTLTIDCGAQTVRRGTVNQYSGFSLSAGHTARGWLPLGNGNNIITVTANNSASAVSISAFGLYA
jgi:hypothetical protein